VNAGPISIADNVANVNQAAPPPGDKTDGRLREHP
jgi:hypothetical protein